jgi:hypothetical protein
MSVMTDVDDRITYLNTASFALYLLPTLWRRYRKPDYEKADERSAFPQYDSYKSSLTHG